MLVLSGNGKFDRSRRSRVYLVEFIHLQYIYKDRNRKQVNQLTTRMGPQNCASL